MVVKKKERPDAANVHGLVKGVTGSVEKRKQTSSRLDQGDAIVYKLLKKTNGRVQLGGGTDAKTAAKKDV